jgi:glutathione S-transferase
MKLYFNPYACSLAPLIAATEAGIHLDLVPVDIMNDPHTLAEGQRLRGSHGEELCAATRTRYR